MSKQAELENKLGSDFASLYDWIGSLETELEQCRVNEHKFVESQKRYRGLVEGSPDAIFEIDEGGKIIDYNTAATRLFNYEPHEFRKLDYRQLFAQSYHADLPDAKTAQADINIVNQLWCMRKDNSMFPAEIHTRYNDLSDNKRLLVYIRDVTDYKKSELLLTSQNRILEFIARGQPLEQVLDAIVVLAEACIDESMCVIHMFDPGKNELDGLRIVRMPANFRKQFGTVQAGDRNGSIGLAALKRETVFSHNLETDPIWRNYRNEVHEFDLKSSVSSPIILSNGELAGVLSVFNFDPEKYSIQLRKPLEVGVHLAGIAIERQRSQRELNSRKAWYKTLFESTHDAIFIFKDGLCIDCNRRATEILKASRDDIIGFTPVDYSPEFQPDGRKSAERVGELFRKANSGHTILFQWLFTRKDGSGLNADVNMQPVAVNEETFVKVTMRDLEEQPGFQRNESEVDKIWKTAFDGSQDGLILVGQKGEMLRVNLAAARMMGYSSDELVGKGWITFLDQISEPKTDRQDVSDQFEIRVLHRKNAEDILIAVTHRNQKNSSKNELHLVVMRDITLYEESKEYLLDFERRYRSVLGNVPVIMLALDEQKKINFSEGKGFNAFNIKSKDLLGQDAEELLKDITIHLGRHAEIPVVQLISEVKKGTSFKGLVKLKDRYFDTRLLPNIDKDGINRGTVIVGMDVTKRQKAKEQLEEQQLLFRQLFQSSPVGIIMMDKEYRVQMINPAFQDIFGYEEEEVIGKNLDDIIVSEDYRQEAQCITSGSYSGATVQKESVRIHKTGKEIPVIIYGFPVKNNDDPISIFGFYVDISDRKRAENQLLKSLEEKEVLMAEIHHRVKNNLAVISGLLELTIQNEDDEGLKKKLLDSELRLKTIALIHEKLYHSEQLSSISFDRYIRELVTGISKKMGTSAPKPRVFYELDAVDLKINQAIPAALIINELVTNAYKHAFKGRGKGVLRIYMSRIRNWVTLCVRDNGDGFLCNPHSICDKTLGIKLIHMLTEQLQGNVEFDNTDGTTCTMKFKLED